MNEPLILRSCLRQPIAEIRYAASLLDLAVTEHQTGRKEVAAKLIVEANNPLIREWTESIWGSNSSYTQYREVLDIPAILPKEHRVPVRMPSAVEKSLIHQRDGFHCRFCGIPVIRKEIRVKIAAAYPDALPWGRTNQTQHAAFQAMWAQYDHVLPHARGGNNELDNVVLTCAPCNFGRMSFTLEEVGLIDPRTSVPYKSDWDGLERFK